MAGAKFFAFIGILFTGAGAFFSVYAFVENEFGVAMGAMMVMLAGIPTAAMGSFFVHVAAKLEAISIQERTTIALLKVIAFNSGPMKEVLRDNPDYFTEQQTDLLEAAFSGLRNERRPTVE